MSSAVWGRFVAALEVRGVAFSDVANASDRASVIHASGIRDALDIAVIETEWGARCRLDGGPPRSTPGGGASPSHASFHASSSSAQLSGNATVGQHRATGRLALDAYAPEQLSMAPEEVQDGVIAFEVLSALIGHPGSYFVLRDGVTFEATTHVPLAMRTAVASALDIADAYRAVAQVESSEFGAESLVSMALGEVISDVAASYAHNVSELMKRCSSRSMPLLMVLAEAHRIGHHMVRIRSILPTTSSKPSLDDAAGGAIGGGVLLNLLHSHYVRHSGNKEDERLLSVLLRRAIRPYLCILRQWIQEGVLNDPFHEFFVTENGIDVDGGGSAHTVGGGRGQLDWAKKGGPSSLNVSVSAFRELIAHTSVLGTATAAGQQGGVHGGVGSGDEVYQYDRRFMLDKSKIPSFLLSQGRVAKMVFYSGKYCCLLREYNGELPKFTGLAAAEEDAWQWTNADALHRLVEECYHRSSGAIIDLLRGPSVDLMGHLESLKSYFFQQRSDWLVDFLDTADDLLHKSPVQVKAHSIRVLLQSAIAKSRKSDPYHAAIGCSFADTTFAQYIELSLRQSGQPPRGSGRISTMHIETRRTIELLQLEVDLRWPLTLILDPVALKHMNNVFRLLLWVKVCERSVYRWWHRGIGKGSLKAHGLKQQMLQFLRQFQFYAAHFVIEPNWAKLMGRMQGADDVLSLSHALQDFFENLEHGLILSNLTRFRSFAKILDVISRFGDLGKVAVGRDNDAHMEDTCQTIEDSFLKLLAELANPRGEDYPQLVPLLTWVDFSRFYDQHNVYKVQHGTTPSQASDVNPMSAARSAAQQQSRPRE